MTAEGGRGGTPERILLYEDALTEVLRAAKELQPTPSAVGQPGQVFPLQNLPLMDAFGRVLARPILAERDQPPFDRSTRDGFAVQAADVRPGTALRIAGLVRAGERWTGSPLKPGEALEIMTGAPMPEGADAVLMVEHGAVHGNTLRPDASRTLQAGENIVPRGAEVRAGIEVVPFGRVLGAAEIALAASCGYAEVTVFPLPHVGILATGDELIELSELPSEAQIRNSNSYALAALVRGENGSPERLPIARDTREDLRQRLPQGQRADLLLLSGGVSMGKYDLVEEALREAGAEFLFTGTRIQPGRPMVFGRIPRIGDSSRTGRWTPFFGLPGNPISTEVCFRLFVAPLLRALAGRFDLAPRFAEARLAEDIHGSAQVTRFLPAEISGDWKGVTVKRVPWQGSGDLAANGRANGFVVLPMGVSEFAAGEVVRVLLR